MVPFPLLSKWYIAKTTKNTPLLVDDIKHNLINFDYGVIVLEENSTLTKVVGTDINLSKIAGDCIQFKTTEIYNSPEYRLYEWKHL